MTPPISIDGTDITGATIDGTDVTEITVDGQTVFTSTFFSDSFEDNDVSDWTNLSLDTFGTSSTNVRTGSHAMVADANGNTGRQNAFLSLPFDTSKTYTITYYAYEETGFSGDDEDVNGGIGLIDTSGSNIGHIFYRPGNSGLGFQTNLTSDFGTLDLKSTSDDAVGQFIEFELEYDFNTSNMSMTQYDASGNVDITASLSNLSFTPDALLVTHSRRRVWYDDITIVES